MPTYGFIGSGDTTAKNTTALIEDLVEGDEAPAFIIPITQTFWTTPIQTVADYAFEQEIPYEVVTDDSSDSHKAFAEIIQAATKVHRVQKVPMKIEAILEKSDEPVLIVAWSDEDADSLAALERALTKDIPSFDLCNGLEPLEFDDESETSMTGEHVDRPVVLDEEFDVIPNDEEDTPESSTEDEPEDEMISSTVERERQVAFNLATPHAAHPEDFESGYSIDIDPDEILQQGLDIMCDRIAARVLTIMAPRMDALERSVRTLGGIIASPPEADDTPAPTKRPARSRGTTAAARTTARTAATEKSSPARKPRATRAEAEEGKKRPGRPRLPRDPETGEIIRD